MIRAILFCFIFLGLKTALKAQEDFARVDAVIQLYPAQAQSAEQLAAFINRDFSSEADKLRAIYGWIINNIAYDPAEYKALDYSFTTVAERNKKQEKFREQLITRVLEKRIAVCEGYSYLFERLCELTGVQSYLVRGDSKASLDDIARSFDVNHMWNIAYISGQAYLFDPTWGAGRYTDRFIKDPTYRFFKADPQHFSYSHFPQLQEDQLLQFPLDRAVFERMPIIVDEAIIDYAMLSPKEGVLQSTNSSGRWFFSLPVSKGLTVGLSVDGGGIKPVKTTWNKETATQDFEMEIPLGAKFLIVHLDERPGVVYLID